MYRKQVQNSLHSGGFGFLADRTNGRAIATLLRLSSSVCLSVTLCMVNGKWLPYFIERLKASAWHQLYLPLLPFTHARSESINADSLKL